MRPSILPAGELLAILQELSLAVPRDVFQRPRPGDVQLVFKQFAARLAPLPPPPDLQNAAQQLLRLFAQTRLLLARAGLTDFCLADLVQPDGFRFRAQLSVLVGYVRFRESLLCALREVRAGYPGRARDALRKTLEEKRARAERSGGPQGEGIGSLCDELSRQIAFLGGLERDFQAQKQELKLQLQGLGKLEERNRALLERAREQRAGLTGDQETSFELRYLLAFNAQAQTQTEQNARQIAGLQRHIQARQQSAQICQGIQQEQQQLQVERVRLREQLDRLDQARAEVAQLRERADKTAAEAAQTRAARASRASELAAEQRRKTSADAARERREALEAEAVRLKEQIHSTNDQSQSAFTENARLEAEHGKRLQALARRLDLARELVELSRAEMERLVRESEAVE